MNEHLLGLPLDIQIALAGGYAAYVLSYSGIRTHHKGTDATFISVIFSALATLILYLIPSTYSPWREIAAVLGAILSGVLWRIALANLLKSTMRALNISWSDDIPTAWASITSHNSEHMVTQISVQTQDGGWLNCNESGRFNDAPFGPCILGTEGDVALYVTDEEPLGADPITNEAIRDDTFGDRITYIPASQIKRITIRHIPRKRSTQPS